MSDGEYFSRRIAELSQVFNHDYWGPIRAVTGFSALLAEELGQGEARSANYLNHLITEGARLQAMAEAIQAALRVHRVQQPFAPVSLQPLLEDAAARQWGIEMAVRCRIEVGPDCKVWGLSDQLDWLFGELFRNCSQFASPERELLTTVSAEREGSLLWVTVADNGLGLAPEQFSRLFRPFAPLHRGIAGLGAGLWRARCIAEWHGGSIQAEPESSGLRVLVTLPVSGHRPEEGPHAVA